jgi:hypothetical protein
MSAELHQLLLTTHLQPEHITERIASIREQQLTRSAYTTVPDFRSIHPFDIALMFDAYDAAFFQGALRRAIGEVPMHFSLSKKMTKAGGRTRQTRDRSGAVVAYEITISSTILYNCFEEDHREITVCGLPCRDRLEALQRILEHEIAHLVEYLVWHRSDCSAVRFKAITLRLFGHTQHTHAMITPKESAFVKHGIRPGVRVRFAYNAMVYTGLVNRVTQRATVLVEDPRGVRYNNGRHYLKFLVPVEQLERVEG